MKRKTTGIERDLKTKKVIPNGNAQYRFIKRTVDIVFSAVGLLACSPILLVTAAAIKIEDPEGTVFYKQPRIGLNGSVFTCYKLRSM